MKKKYTKAGLFVGIVCLALLISIFLFSGYIPFAGKMIAENKIKNYLENTSGAYEKVNMSFDFYNFSNYKGEGYSYDIRNNLIFNGNKVGADLAKTKQDIGKVTQVFPQGIAFNDYHITTYIDGNDFSKHYDRLVIYSAWNDENITAEESKDRATEIIMDILNSEDLKQYNFTSLNVNYHDRHGTYGISVPRTEKTQLTKKVVRVNIEEQKNLALDYIEWKEKLLGK